MPDTGPRVRVNQVGYLPDGPKGATLVTDATEPLRVGAARTRPDASSSRADHAPGRDRRRRPGSTCTRSTSAATTAAATGYTLVADGETSHPFDISSTATSSLRIDALSLYYPQRSGTPIVGDDRWRRVRAARPVTSASRRTPGDDAVPCQTPEFSQTVYGEPWTCDYTLDVTGGWYDAGDHGKYVVNGGISVAQLMSTYERTQNAPRRRPGARRRHAADPRAAATASPTCSTRRAGSSSGC